MKSFPNITIYLAIPLIVGSYICCSIDNDKSSKEVNSAYYVAADGKDSNEGTLLSPWRHINYGVGKLVPGDTLCVRGGTYAGDFTVSQSGNPKAPICIVAYPGETPVVEGDNIYPEEDWDGLITLTGNYIVVNGFEVKNSRQRGIGVYGHHNSVYNCNVHHSYHGGILVTGDYGLVEDTKIWQNSLENVNESGGGMWASGLSFARDQVDGITSHGTARKNIIYNNWGEGLSAFEASHTLFEDNIVYNNWSVNLYISNVWNSVYQRNLLFVSQDTPITGSRRFPSNISWMDEVVSVKGVSVLSHDNIAINNITYGSSICIQCWNTEAAAQAGAGLKNELIANNTFLKGNLYVGSYAHSNSLVVNNIFDIETDISSRPGITFSNNLAEDARLAQTGSFSNSSWSVEYFRPLPASPAINKATVLPQVTDEFFKTNRGTNPDIGAIEYVE